MRPLTNYRNQKELAREFRRSSTTAETRLWEKLRGRQIGDMKFRRQCPVEGFIADFCCIEKRLIIEVDGPIHESTVENDVNRSNHLNEMGYRVLRFTNQQVLENIEKVCQAILDEGRKDSSDPLPVGEGGRRRRPGEAFRFE